MCRGVETIHVVRKSQSTFRVQLEPCGGAYRPCAAPRLPLLHARFRNLAKYPNRARAREAREGEGSTSTTLSLVMIPSSVNS